MELVVDTEYQEVHRIDNGILLVINKFKYDNSYGEHCCLHSSKDKPYHKLTQGLRVLKEDTVKKAYNAETSGYDVSYIVPKGTVLRHSFPVNLVPREEWTYEIKTTSNCFSGTGQEILGYLDDIKRFIINE